jgi:hypothetical protein
MAAPDEGDDTETAAAEPFESLSDTIAKATAEEQEKLGEAADGAEADPAKPAPAKAEHPAAQGRRSVRERRKLERASKELADRQTAVQLAAQERAELEEARELRKLRDENPAEYARRTKLDLDKMTDGFLAGQKPDAKIDALSKQIADDKAEREKERSAAAIREAREEERKFHEELQGKAETYPALADLEPEELFGEKDRPGTGMAYRVSKEVMAELQRLGHKVVPKDFNDLVFAEMNAREQAKIDKRATRLGYAKGAPAAAKPAAGPAKTISGRTTQQRAAAPPPADDFNRVMSSAERVEAMVALAKRQAAG